MDFKKPINHAPGFVSKLVDHTINVFEDEQIAGMVVPKYTYISPMAVDFKKDMISMVFNGGELNCECL